MICEQCATKFLSKRKTAQFCSPKCRKAYSRGKVSVTPPVTDNSVTNVTVKDSVTPQFRKKSPEEIKVLKESIEKINESYTPAGRKEGGKGLFQFCPKHNVFYHTCGCKLK